MTELELSNKLRVLLNAISEWIVVYEFRIIYLENCNSYHIIFKPARLEVPADLSQRIKSKGWEIQEESYKADECHIILKPQIQGVTCLFNN